LEAKLTHIHSEKDRVELKLKEAEHLDSKEHELAIREKQVLSKLDTMREELHRLSALKNENIQLKKDIDAKV